MVTHYALLWHHFPNGFYLPHWKTAAFLFSCAPSTSFIADFLLQVKKRNKYNQCEVTIFLFVYFLFIFFNITITLHSSISAGAFCSHWTSSVTPHGQNLLVWEEWWGSDDDLRFFTLLFLPQPVNSESTHQQRHGIGTRHVRKGSKPHRTRDIRFRALATFFLPNSVAESSS